MDADERGGKPRFHVPHEELVTCAERDESRAGRGFDARDVRPPDSEPRPWRSAIVNETFVRRHFDGRSPVGYRLGVGDEPGTVTDIEIIGVVADFSCRNLGDADIAQVYFLYWPRDADGGAFFVRVRGKLDLEAIRAAVAEVDPALPVSSLRTYADQIDRATWTERALAMLVTGFAVIALLLLGVDTHGLVSFIVTQRRREIGLRLALGSTRGGAVWLTVRDALMMIAAGTVIALPVAWALRRVIESQLYGVSALDARTIALATCVLALMALAAATVPRGARRRRTQRRPCASSEVVGQDGIPLTRTGRPRAGR